MHIHYMYLYNVYKVQSVASILEEYLISKGGCGIGPSHAEHEGNSWVKNEQTPI